MPSGEDRWDEAYRQLVEVLSGVGKTDRCGDGDYQAAWLRAEIDKGHFATPEDAIAYAIEQAKRALLQESLDAAIERGGANSADQVRHALANRLRGLPWISRLRFLEGARMAMTR